MLKLKPSFLFKQKRGSGVGGSSVFMLLSLVNKETVLGLVIGQKLGRQGDRMNSGRKKAATENCHGAARIRHAKSFPVSHDLMVNTDLIELG